MRVCGEHMCSCPSKAPSPTPHATHHRSLSKSACRSGNIVFLGVLASGHVGMIRFSSDANGLQADRQQEEQADGATCRHSTAQRVLMAAAA